ncbi:MAG: Crp/Fnr family transcriptional regulator [Parvibaculaceae bacterium]|nr:Crp/Fnr family transcriptional regulator [Parvibaculaceae bacterium]
MKKEPGVREATMGGWFASQPEAVRAALLSHGHTAAYLKGTWINAPSEEPGVFCGVVSGSVSLHAILPRGDLVLVDLLHRGEWFGQGSLYHAGPVERRILIAMAAEPVQLLIIGRRDLLDILRDHPELWASVAELGVRQLEYAISGWAETLSLPPKARLAARLLNLRAPADAGRGDSQGRIPLTQSEIAEAVGLSRQLVNRFLREFERRGVIRTGYGAVEIIDPDYLTRLVETE